MTRSSRITAARRRNLGSKTHCRRGPPEPPCYEISPDHPHLSPFSSSLSSRGRYAFRTRKPPSTQPLVAAVRAKHNEDFHQFSLLPEEVRDMIWELIAQEPRIVSVRIGREQGPSKLRSLISTPPAVLHVCSRSRAIGLKYTTLSFASISIPFASSNNGLNAISPPKVYFNPEIDTLWFSPTWNQGVDGKWCCFNQLPWLVDLDDLKQVRSVGFDLNSRTCSTRRDPTSSFSHVAFFNDYKALERVYLGLSLTTKDNERYPIEIALRKLGCEEEETDFMRLYDEKWRKHSMFPNQPIGANTNNGRIGSWFKSRRNELGVVGQALEQFEPVIVIPKDMSPN